MRSRSPLLVIAASAAAFVVGLALAIGQGGCACTLIGCSDSVSIQADLPLAFADLKTSHLTMCRNSSCDSSLDLSQLGQPPTAGMDTLLGGAPVSATVGMAAGGSLWLEATWVDANLAIGDVFSLTVTDASGTTVISETDTATSYETYSPNGASCPPTCSQRTFDHRTH